MKYNCLNEYMIRTPNLPYKYWKEYLQYGDDIYKFISENKELDIFFKKALLISSKPLYNSYINVPKQKKKYVGMCKSLLKYFIRSTTRPTPYGYYSGVSLGNFSNNSEFIRSEEKFDIKLDTNWVNELIRKLENDINILKHLEVQMNKVCFVSGDRIKNPYLSNRGVIKTKGEIELESSIRYTKLIELIKNNTNDFIKVTDLFFLIKKEYEDVPEEMIEKVLIELIENEYLFSNLKIPAYCEDNLSHVLNNIKFLDSENEIYKTLVKIKKLFKITRKNLNPENICEIYKLMEQLCKSKNYIEFNLGYSYEASNLNKEIKNKIEKFVDTLSDMAFSSESYGVIQKFKDSFTEEFGERIEVPLIEIIDGNKFDGLTLLQDVAMNVNQTENQINRIIKNKIDFAVLKGEDVHIYKSDLGNIDNKKRILSKGFDLNLFITYKDDEYFLTVGPNVGSSKQGAMFQRFADCFDEEKFNRYNKIYDEVRFLEEEDYISVELRECAISGRFNNVINNTKNYYNYLSIGMIGNSEGELELSDIMVGMENNKIYLKSKRLNKKIKFVKDNMLNPNLNSQIFKLLYEISQTYEDVAINRIFMFENNSIYTPRIYIEDVLASLKKWHLEDSMFDLKNIDTFLEDFYNLKSQISIDRIIYIVESDHRLMIDTENKEEINLLYEEIKKNKKIIISEVEPELMNSKLVLNQSGDAIINEMVFSVFLDKTENKKIFEQSQICKYSNLTEKINFCQDGWVYFKLYGLKERSNELLIIDLQKLIKELDYPKYFFIRYGDEIGQHLRIRIKFKNEEESYKKIFIINNWIKNCKEKSLINRVVFDEYIREVNRYGGYKLIGIIEEFFCEDSKEICNILNEKSIVLDEKEIYLSGILRILLFLTNDDDELFKIVDNASFRTDYRKEYKKNRTYYIETVENILNEKRNTEKKYIVIMEKIKTILNENYDDLYNTKDSILLSIAHMHCNRLTGDRNLERKYITILRHSLYDIYARREHLKKK